MINYYKNKLIVISMILPLVSLFFDKYKDIGSIRHGLGLPFKFLWFMGKTVPNSRWLFFLPDNLIKINFRVDIYLFCVLIIYLFLNILEKIYLKLNN